MSAALTPERLVDRLFEYLHGAWGRDADLCRAALLADYRHSGARSRPDCLRSVWPIDLPASRSRQRALATRQQQHRPQALAPGEV